MMYTLCNHLCLQAIDLVHMDPSLFPFIPSDGYINLTFGLPNFPTEFVDPSIIQDADVLIETPFISNNVRVTAIYVAMSLHIFTFYSTGGNSSFQPYSTSMSSWICIKTTEQWIGSV